MKTEESLMLGEWKNTESFISAGGPQFWVDAENGEEISFLKNGKFRSNRFAECQGGNFSIESDTLILDYSCRGFQSDAENEQDLITYILEFNDDHFILTPTSGPICIEGCSFKFEKL